MQRPRRDPRVGDRRGCRVRSVGTAWTLLARQVLITVPTIRAICWDSNDRPPRKRGRRTTVLPCKPSRGGVVKADSFAAPVLAMGSSWCGLLIACDLGIPTTVRGCAGAGRVVAAGPPLDRHLSPPVCAADPGNDALVRARRGGRGRKPRDGGDLGPATIGAGATLAATGVFQIAGGLIFGILAVDDRAPGAGDRHRSARVPAVPGIQTLVLTAFVADSALGMIDITVTAFAERHGQPSAAGLLLAVFALTSVLTSAVLGVRHWDMPPRQRLVVLTGTAALLLALGNSIVARKTAGPRRCTIHGTVDNHPHRA